MRQSLAGICAVSKVEARVDGLPHRTPNFSQSADNLAIQSKVGRLMYTHRTLVRPK
jgi:hypothetical protein